MNSPLFAPVVMTSEAQRALVIGSGPIGIDAAIRLAREGFGVTLCEKGSAVAASLRHWSHCRLFSANALNCSAAGLEVLAELNCPHPAPTACPSGEQYCSESNRAHKRMDHSNLQMRCSRA